MSKDYIQLSGCAAENNPHIFRSEIGETIRQIRENRGLTQKQLAEKMNVSRSTISKIESGKFNFSIDYLSKFAEFLRFDITISTKELL